MSAGSTPVSRTTSDEYEQFRKRKLREIGAENSWAMSFIFCFGRTPTDEERAKLERDAMSDLWYEEAARENNGPLNKRSEISE